jgi:hypothetical protein
VLWRAILQRVRKIPDVGDERSAGPPSCSGKIFVVS